MKWLFRILFILMAAIGLTIGALLLMPGDKLGAILAEQVKAQTGRDLVLEGDVRFSFWPVLGLETGPVRFANATWAGPEPMLSASSLEVGVDASALLSGEVRIGRVLARDPVLRLELSDGRGNWEMGPRQQAAPAQAALPPDGPKPASQPSSVTLDKLELINARLVYVENGAVRMDFANVNLSASWPDISAPMRMDAEMPVPGGAVVVALSISDLPAFSSGQATPLALDLSAPGGQVNFDGRVNLAGEMDGRTRITTTDTHKMLAAFGQAGVTVPQGLGRKADVRGQMTYTRDGRIALRDIQVALDQNRITGNADILVAATPYITANLTAGHLDLSRVADADAGTQTRRQPKNDAPKAGSSPRGDDGWSKQPIDASVLGLANGQIRLRAESIAVPGLEIGASDLTLSLDRSRAVMQMNPATLFAGQLTGQVVANNRNGLSVGGKLSAQGVDLQQALTALAGVERLSGKGGLDLEFLGEGQSEDQIMRSLSGKGSLKVGKGVIAGIDLDRLMGRGDAVGGTTVFNSLTASFVIRKGNLRNNDLLMQLDNFRADGSGRIGLGRRDIDYVFTPVALRANSGEGLAVPVRIQGPWSNPSIKPDLSKVIEAATDEKLKELEQDAKQKALRKAGEELDTTITDSDQIEDAVKKKLEEEAKKGLLKLLGNN